MQTFRREVVDDNAEKIGSMKVIVRKAKCRLNSFTERSMQQGAAVIPATLMPRQRPYSHRCQLLRQTEPMQNARCIWANLDAGTNFSQLQGLLVYVDIESRLQQR